MHIYKREAKNRFFHRTLFLRYSLRLENVKWDGMGFTLCMVSRLENLILGQVRIEERQVTYGALVELKINPGLVQRIFEKSD